MWIKLQLVQWYAGMKWNVNALNIKRKEKKIGSLLLFWLDTQYGADILTASKEQQKQNLSPL